MDALRFELHTTPSLWLLLALAGIIIHLHAALSSIQLRATVTRTDSEPESKHISIWLLGFPSDLFQPYAHLVSMILRAWLQPARLPPLSSRDANANPHARSRGPTQTTRVPIYSICSAKTFIIYALTLHTRINICIAWRTHKSTHNGCARHWLCRGRRRFQPHVRMRLKSCCLCTVYREACSYIFCLPAIPCRTRSMWHEPP